MKKVQVPLALPVILAAAVAALTGVLVYSAFTQRDDVTNQPPAVQVAVREIDKDAVLKRLESAKANLITMGAAKSDRLKGSYLNMAATELETAKAYCGASEENLSQFLTALSTAFRAVGDKLMCGGTLSEADSNNLTELTDALDNAISIGNRAVDEDNGDYLRGEFSLPALQMSVGNTVSREDGEKAAKAVVENAAFKEEKDYYYSFNGEGYILEVSKKDGSVMYRRTGYEAVPVELTGDRLNELTESAKQLLRDKGYGDTALIQWQAAEGELSLGLYPISGGVIYMNAPFNVVLSIADGSLLGLRTTTYSPVNVESNEDLLKKLQTYQDSNYIIPAVYEYGVPCYMVSCSIGGTEYISFWNILTEQEIKLSKIENDTYGRRLSEL